MVHVQYVYIRCARVICTLCVMYGGALAEFSDEDWDFDQGYVVCPLARYVGNKNCTQCIHEQRTLYVQCI